MTNIDGIDVTPVDNYGSTPLHRACASNNTDIITKLLSFESVDINKKDRYVN